MFRHKNVRNFNRPKKLRPNIKMSKRSSKIMLNFSCWLTSQRSGGLAWLVARFNRFLKVI